MAKNSPKIDIEAFTFASAEVNLASQIFIRITELLTGKLILRKLYNNYLNEDNPPENFWHDAIKKLELKIISNYHSRFQIPKKGRLIVVANHAFGVIDGVILCSLISKVRQDYKMITHKVLRQAEAVKEKIIPIDFVKSQEAIINNINAKKKAEEYLQKNGVIVIFPSGTIATKKKLSKKSFADDGEWKQFTSRLAKKTNSSVLPIFFEGGNSQLFHIANKLGLTFKYALMMHELKRKIGSTVKVHIGDVIDSEKIAYIGDLKKITKYIRNKTYSLDPSSCHN